LGVVVGVTATHYGVDDERSDCPQKFAICALILSCDSTSPPG
jgi:hypothetical protein